ncbi:hypothetical protein K493DRAFT_377413 [Basidiobolus meristosporus CBS 931.73]|uniref:Carrier domain-containing protein n=1 Tax=Basidiobolus meristosporus CBS 931.73 TaxID=1314790 RepID=A0A1Y1Y292_9FUNG|nr:hypothetical protein K493DRAFT_377413 [Basidiobolus meristosporus CBS 931.73]|eukprot:ORX92132.1 hypothetical protein K493DRAFT_377413 [Basidiobolus meristosporus CBS 931.73]
MNIPSANACLLLPSSSSEVLDTAEKRWFHVTKSNVISVDRVYKNGMPEDILNVEISLVHAAWAILLNLYTGDPQISFGTSIRNQSSSSLANNIQVFHSSIDETTKSLSVVEWVRQLANTSPVESVDLESGNVEHTFNTSVLFASDDEIVEMDINQQFAAYAVSWLVNGELNIRLSLSNTHFQQDQGRLYADQFVYIMQKIVSNLNTPLRSLDWTSDKEKILLLNTWQHAKPDYIPELDDRCIHQLVEEQADKTPFNIALQFEDKEFVTYAELNRRSNRLAYYLIDLGVGPEKIVPICIDKSIDMVVAILAVLKSGAAYVPLDPEYPKERVSFILEETKSTIVLTTSDLKSVFTACTNILLTLLDSGDIESHRKLEKNPVVPQLDSSSLCYVIFTSGSTGTPKGVMVEHRAVVNYTASHKNILSLDESDRFLQFSNFTFDASILDLFVNLTIGSRICLASKNNLLTNLSEMAHMMKVTAAQLTTTVAGLLKPSEVPTLRKLQQGGEMMTKPIRDTWCKSVDLHNGYGPTETTVYTMVRKSLSTATACNNIGWPIGRNKVYILNDTLGLVPLGAVGELYFGGPQLARGYLNRPELTESAFIDSPFCLGERLYKSGDLGRYNLDGSIVILGRKDNQVKLNGLRIELDEIEHVLHQHSNVARASARLLNIEQPSNQTERNRALVAFVTFKSVAVEDETEILSSGDRHGDISAMVEEIQELTRRKLPPYMVPTLWIPLTRIPINTSGKTDFRLLEKLFKSYSKNMHSRTNEYNELKTQPNSPIEKILQKAWAEVLNIEQSCIGTSDSFYHLGGDSISAIQVSSMCRQMGVKVSVQSILQYPTIQQAVDYAQLVTDTSIEYEPTDWDDQMGTKSLIPLTPIQQQFLGVEQSNINHFHLSWLVKVRYPLQKWQLVDALNRLVEHHSMLRVRFSRVDGCWKQQLIEKSEKNIEVERSEVQVIEDLKRRIHGIQSSLNLESGPVSSFALFDLPEGEQLLFMTIHHYLIDLVSWRIIWEDLENLLNGGTLSYKSISFLTWSKLLRNRAASLDLTDWPKQELMEPLKVDISKLDLNTMESVHTLSFSLEEEHTSLLFGVSNDAYRTEAVDFMLSSLATAYCTTFDARSLTIAAEGHGREPWKDSIDISRTVGWFTTIYPVSIQVYPEESAIDVLMRTKDIRRNIPYHGFNYGLLRYLNEKTASNFRNDFFQVGFNYLGRFQHLEKANALLQDVSDQYKFDLGMIGPTWKRMNAIEVEVTMKHQKLSASISYSNALHEKPEMEQWLQTWRDTLIEVIVKCANQTTSRFTNSDFPLLGLTKEEADKLQFEILPQYDENLAQNVEDIYPCSPIQEGLIIGNMRSPELYHVQDVYQLRGHWSFEELNSAWMTAIQDLPILRTIFLSSPFTKHSSGLYVQVVLRQIKITTDYISARNGMADEALMEYLATDITKGFPLGKPNIRLCVIREIDGCSRMIISRHHATNDGWSDRIIMKYVHAIYNRIPKPAALPFKEFIKYYIEEQKEYTDMAGREFWCRYLSNAEPCLLPKLGGPDFPKDERFQLTATCSLQIESLKTFAKKAGVTTFTLFQAAWGMVLRPYYGAGDCIYGVLVNGRNISMKGIDEVVGPCFNTLPLRISYEEEEPVFMWLRRIHQHMIDSIPYQQIGLQTIKGWCKASGCAPEFDSILNFQPVEQSETASRADCDLYFELENTIEPTEYTLGLNIWIHEGVFKYRLDYSRGTLPPALASLFINRLEAILQAFLNVREDTKVLAIPRISEYERQMIISFGGSSTVGQYECIHKLFERQVQATPKNVAVQTEEGHCVTYESLNKQANNLAHYLRDLGIGSRSVVPIYFHKSVEMIVAMLAVLKAGGAYLPLDLESPTSRIRIILQEAEANIVVTTSAHHTLFNGYTAVTIDQVEETICQYSSENPVAIDLEPSDPCYILYTSGSTGVPKGVILEHSAVTNFLFANQENWQLNDQDSVLQFASYTFDASVVEIFTPFMVGARVAVASREKLLNALESTIELMKVSASLLVPTVAATVRPWMVPSMKKLLVGGEMLTTSVRDTWASRVQLTNLYGPTEAAVAFMMNPKVQVGTACNNVGRPIRGNKIYILDSQLQTVPLGVAGELCVAGNQLARGYLNRPEITEKAFSLNPYDNRERMYRTGDLARYNLDGSVELIGRIDNQIKLNGLRIELDELENALHEHPKVLGACVLAMTIDTTPKRKILAAFLAFSSEFEETETECKLITTNNERFVNWIAEARDLVRSKVPSYMVPAVWLPISRMPRSSAGKLDRKKLANIFAATNWSTIQSFTQIKGRNYSKPITKNEKYFQDLWLEVLNITENEIGVNDSFFSLGGDSILAIKLVSLARQSGCCITVQQVFEHPTIARLASLAQPLQVQAAEIAEADKYSLLQLNPDDLERLLEVDVAQNGITPEHVEDIYPCSPLQEGLFALGMRSSSDYLTQQVFVCKPEVDLALLKSAWASVIEANPILRTTIVFTNSGHPHLGGLQVVLVGGHMDWTVIKCPSNTDITTELSKVLKQDQERGIEMGKLLARFTVLRDDQCRTFFIWTIHHTLYDGWSMGLLIEDLVTAYRGAQLAKRPAYSRFIEYVIDQDRQEAIEYWAQLLDQVTATHIAKPTVHSYKPQARTLIRERICADFSILTGAHSLTLATIVNLAWALVLKCHTGNSDVVFGVVNSGRSVPVAGIDQICGPCITTLPVRVNLSDNPTMLEVMTGMHRRQVEQHRFQNIGLQDIQKLCVGELGSSLFDSLLAVQNLDIDQLGHGLHSIGMEVVKATMPSNYAVVVELATGADGHELSILYDENLIHNDEAKWIFEHMKTALLSIPDNAETRVDDFGIISSKEYELLRQWSGSFTRNSPECCIHTLFEEQVLRTPDNIAVQFENEEFVTYHELNCRANRLAHHLIDIGVDIETVVPLCLGKSVDMIVAILGVLKSGAAYVPIDPENPLERNEFIVKQTNAQVVITTDMLKGRFRRISIINMDCQRQLLCGYSTDNPLLSNHGAKNLCYIIYTSGSTGAPKGVMLEHSSVANYLHELVHILRLTSDDRVLQFLSYTFDASILDIFSTLSTGGCLCMARKELLLTDLTHVLQSMNVTLGSLTPTLASLLQPKSLPHLNKLIIGGEMMTTDISDRWASRVRVTNAYGPTETAIAFMVNPEVDTKISCSNVGRPTAGNEIYILDPKLRMTPMGAVGELCVAGCQLARGYFNRPDLTEKAFVPNPFRKGERMYRTGDLARFNMDGTVELLGRKDNQIKLNGLRIELDEIEHTLHIHPEVARACVLPLIIDELDSRKVLVAFLYFHTKSESGPETHILRLEDLALGAQWISEIRDLITSKLPPYMMPHIFLPMSQMPTNVSGKIDRKQLEAHVRGASKEQLYAFSRSQRGRDNVPPTDRESLWLKIWSPVLNVPENEIGVNDSFFSLGGDSISAIKLVSLARQSGCCITVQQVFEHPTIARLASLAQPLQVQAAEIAEADKYSLLQLNPDDLEQLLEVDVAQNGITPEHVEDIYPCSPLQEGLFALGMRSSSDYLTQQVFVCKPEVDLALLKSAWASVIEANPILRTTIVFTNSGHPHLGGLQVVLVGGHMDWTVIKCPSNTDITTELSKVLKQDQERGIEMGKLLARFTVLRDDQCRTFFIWTIHHTLYDGWSMGLLIEDLVTAYRGAQLAKRPAYSRFIEYVIDQDRQEAIEYWAQLLDQVTATHIAKPTVHSYKPQARTLIRERICADFSILTGAHSLTLATIVNLAWALVLKCHTGNSDVVFGVANSGRSVPVAGIDQICGPCITTLPVRVNLSDNPTMLEVMTGMHRRQVEQHRFQNIGLQDIQKLCVGELGSSLFDSLLAVQNLDIDQLGPGLHSIGMEVVKATMPSNYAVVVELATGADGHELSILYDENLIHNDEAKWIFEHMKTALLSIPDNAETRVDDFGIISSKEYELLRQWSGSFTRNSPECCIHTLFEEQVLRTPDNIAVQFENEEFVTYHELNCRANRLAHHLIDIGVNIETLVPVCLDRSVNMIVTLLAILKSGGAYVPLDPGNPDDRNRFIIEETRSNIVVANSQYRHKFDGVVTTVVIIEDQPVEEYSSPNPAVIGITAANLCYAIYTSGSTGLPKGVLLEHGSVVNFIVSSQFRWRLVHEDRALQFSSYTFDMFVMEVYNPLACGARTVLARKEALYSNLNQIISDTNITAAWLTPSVASLLNSKCDAYLRKLSVGGEMMTTEIKDRWSRKVSFSNMYGPTEAAVVFMINSEVNHKTSCSNIGRPIGGNEIYILDPKLRMTPMGAVGELCVAGCQLARGYFNRPDLTEKAFVPNPFRKGERMYRTGDLARFNMDGTVELLGRKDNQIKLNGLRIELDEIEHTLHIHPEVARACVLPLIIDELDSRKVLVAFLYFHTKSESGPETHILRLEDLASGAQWISEIRDLITSKLPPYMMPHIFLPMSQMPTNVSGKIDRKQLEAHVRGASKEQLYAFSRSQRGRDNVPPTDRESLWLKIWSPVLNVPENEIGVNDSFFSLGGDSISAIKLVSLARQSGCCITVQQVFEHPTIARLASLAQPLQVQAAEIAEADKCSLLQLNPDDLERLLDVDVAQNGITPEHVEDIYPCSPLQEGLFALGMRSSSDYLTQQVFVCKPEVDLALLKSAWASVIEANPILRTTIVFTNSGHPHLGGLQVVLVGGHMDWTVIKCPSNTDITTELSKVLKQDQERGIEMGKLLARFTVLRDDQCRTFFIWTIHHTLYDGWSMGLLIEDLVTAYRGAQLAKRPAYSRFIEYVIDQDRQEAIEYWAQLLDQVTATHIAKPTVHSYKPQARTLIRERICADFSILTGAHSLTLATIVNLAWALVLKCHTGNSDVVFGVVNSGRSVPVAGIDQICGPCITTLPVRVNLSDNSTMLEVMTGMHRRQVEQHRFQNIGLQDIQKLCVGELGSSLFDSLLAVQNLDIDQLGHGLHSIGMEVVKATMPSNYAVVVELATGADGHELSILYDENLIHNDEAKWIFEHMKTALLSIPDNAETRVDDFGIISSKEYELLRQWSGSFTRNSPECCIHTLFEEQVLRTPDNIAVQFENEEFVTYHELNCRANRLAHHLIDIGVNIETLVPVCLDRSVNMIVTLLAILKSGGAYVPLDPGNPDDRNRFIIEETRSNIVVANSQYRHKFDGVVTTVVIIEDQPVEEYSSPNPAVIGITAANLCYAIYTSGSTGLPKGVLLEHGSVANFINGMQDIWKLSVNDSVLQMANYTFDLFVIEVYVPLLFGARACIASKKIFHENIDEAISGMNITSAMFTPTVLSLLNPNNLRNLRKLCVGGEMMTATIRDTWAPHVQLSNAYGPTEAAVAVLVNKSLSAKTSCSNIGKPLSNNRIYIMDSKLRLTPLGAVGELCISGAQLARSYLNRPEQTAAAFVPNPYLDGERLYRTGDLARFNFDGSIELMGRRDNQIKLRGLRIELDEIEHAIHEHSEVKRACVVLMDSGSNMDHNTLVAFLTFDGFDKDAGDVRMLTNADSGMLANFIKEVRELVIMRLPPYMIPSLWVPLNTMPRNNSGKIDRKALSATVADLSRESMLIFSSSNQTKSECSTTLEKALQAIWAETLNIDVTSIGVNDLFYHLGGDSISAIRVSSLCRQKGIFLSVQQIMQNSTIRELALASTQITEKTDMIAEDLNGFVPLTPILAYFLEQKQTNVHHFNQSWLLRLQKPTTHNALLNALRVIVDNHDMLRARFSNIEENPVLSVLPPAEVQFKVHHRRIESVDEIRSHVHQLQRSLNIVTGPLFQFALYDTPEGEQLIFMTVHHYIIDLVSWRIIWDDLEQLLQGKECNYKSMSFMKWSRMLNDYAKTLDISLWTKYPVVQPVADDYALEKNLMSTTKMISFNISNEQTENLFGVCNHAFQTEALDLMISSLAIAYCNVFNSESLTIGMESHGREAWCEDIDTSRTIGWFTSIYPITIKPAQTENALATLKNVKDIRKMIPNNGFSYGLLSHLSGPDNRLRNDKIQIGFNYVGRFQQLEKADAFFQQPDDEYDFDTCQISDDWKRNHVFDISVGVNRGLLEATITFSTALHSQETVSLWLKEWEEALHTIIELCVHVSRSEHTRSDFPLLPLSEADFHLLYHQKLPESGIDTTAVDDILPCTHLQEGLIAGMLKNPEYYHVQQTYQLIGSSNITQLKKAWKTVVDTHPILRTVFVQNPIIQKNGPIFLQVVVKNSDHQWVHIVCDEDSVQSERMAYLAEDKIASFPLGEPAMRFALLETNTGISELVISWHHAILDATSWKLILADFEAVYHSTLRPVTYPFKSFISRMLLRTHESSTKETQFWQNKLSGVENLPFPKLSVHRTDCEKSQIYSSIETPLSEILQFARRSGVTLFTLIQASWAMLLKMYTQAKDVTFGYVVDGRNSEIKGIDRIVGPCINMLPCRIRYDEQAPIHGWLQEIQQDYASTISYQQSSLRNIEHWTETSPLIDTAINYLPSSMLSTNSELGEISANRLKLVPCQDAETTEYPLTLLIGPDSSRLTYRLDISGKIADTANAKIIARDYSKLFDSLIHAKSDALLGDISCVLHDCVYASTNASLGDALSKSCIHNEFERQVLRTPSNIAVQFGVTMFITYSELNKRANRLANYLLSLGITAESMVPICFDKSIDMIVAMLAILKAGGAYVPIDPDHPIERVRFIVKDTKATIIVTAEDHKEKFEGQTLVLLSKDQEAIEKYSSDNPVVSNLTPEALCYIIYTSGSTGAPKGVLMEHSAVLSFVRAQQEIWNLTEEDAVLQFASYTFDASVLDIYCSLLSGARVCMESRPALLSSLDSVMRSMDVTCANLTTTIAGKIRPKSVPSLKKLQLGGEMMTTTIRDTWAPHVQLSNGYGPTEAAVAVTIQQSLSTNTSCSNVGKPIGFNIVHIVDSDLRQVPTGVVGELCISGPQLARGYLNRPTLTESVFVKNPFGNGKYMYRTGDLARFNSDGSIELNGRKDNQIKLHGLRIELDEIDHALHEHPKVARACTLLLVVDKTTNRKVLVAFVSLNERVEDMDVKVIQDYHFSTYMEEIRAHVQNKLPHYMVPVEWVPLSRLPTNSSGKVDRRSLSTIFEQINIEGVGNFGFRRNITPISPRTAVESSIQKIWSEVLDCPEEKIGINESFQSLGGDSILAIQVSSSCRKANMHLSVQNILQYQTIGRLAQYLESDKTEKHSEDNITEGPVPLTPNQRMFLGIKQTNVNQFNQAWLLQVREPISSEALTKSIYKLIEKHDILRARFAIANGNWELKIFPVAEDMIQVHHRHIESVDEIRSHVHQLQRSLNIVTGPLFQFALYDTPEGEQLIFMTVHHYIIDLVSWRIIWDDLEQLLQGKECNYKSMSFMKWSRMLADYGRSLDSSLWPKQPVVEPLCSDPSLLAKNTVGSSRSLSFKLNAYFSKLANSFCGYSASVGVLDLLIASLAYSFCSVFERHSLLVALEFHGRQAWDSSIDISRTVGWFTNIYPVSVSVTAKDTILDVIRQIMAQRRQIQGNEVVYGLQRYCNKTNDEHDHDPLQISFGYMPKSFKLESHQLLQPITSESKYSFDLQSVAPEWRRQQIFNCAARYIDEELEATIVYSQELHSELQVQTWVNAWEAAMIDAVVSISKEDPGIPRNTSNSTLLPYDGAYISPAESAENCFLNATTGSSVTHPLDECLSLICKATGAPMFIIHCVIGISSYFELLREHMNHTLYSISDPTLGTTVSFESIEAMAARYLVAIRQVQAEGPYHLHGYSFGGLVAFEAARQLEAEGSEVARVTVIDALAPIASTKVNMDIYSSQEYLDLISRLGQWNIDESAAHMICNKIECNTRLMRKYRPPEKKLNAKVVLVKATSNRRVNDNESVCYGWSKYSSRVAIHTIDAHHHELMFDPHISKIARYLQ